MEYSEISHFSHPEHKLKFEYSEFPFKCDGCNEVGIGSRYECSICDYDLNVHCAVPSPSICHAFYKKCSFQFLTVPPGDLARIATRARRTKARSACHRCERKGRSYRSECKKYSLHVACVREMIVESWYEIYREGIGDDEDSEVEEHASEQPWKWWEE
ncbi:hypothetical protein K1719_000446 [Acacia pycnantha]|nr:hypothetical protein K1719_000446 [Acacia pycnantha]